jgi:hypothetical protein
MARLQPNPQPHPQNHGLTARPVPANH